ncbi:hypothetical protein ACS0TY_026711 [Phlomoides rotata]
MKPNSSLQVNGLVNHAAEVYTLTLFKYLRINFKRAYQGETNRVIFDYRMKYVNCSCKKFEECDMLCCHYIWILQINCVQIIPDIYIRTGWTKKAKTATWDKNKGKEVVRIQTSIPWRHQMARKTYNLILESEQSEEARKILEEGTDIQKIQQTSIEFAQNMTILDLKRSTTKGRKTRLKNHFQRSNKKSSGTTREFGTQTPNAHIFLILC